MENYSAENLVKLLIEKEKTLAVAESLTGGMVATKICDIAGASRVFLEGVVSYSEESKMKRLSVSELSLEKSSAVSEDVCLQMAYGVRSYLDADYGISTTGVAGPDDFDKDGNPKGLFFVGISCRNKTEVFKFKTFGDRNYIREFATNKALETAYKIICKENGENYEND